VTLEITDPGRGDVLAPPIRRRLFDALSELRRPATTQELAERIERHPNSVRTQLQRLADAGLLERRTIPQARGRPLHEWTIAPGARPGGQPPRAYGQLARWLARALARPHGLEALEAVGREIGRELAPPPDRPAADALRDAMSALGFAPSCEPSAAGHRFVLGNCPYRDAVRANQPAICTLHRGLTAGLLERVDPGAKLVGFVSRDPDAAGCLVDVEGTTRP
jgi:predicted ArsR family transcriptional regulator